MLGMGFEESAARGALRRSSSVDDAIDLLAAQDAKDHSEKFFFYLSEYRYSSRGWEDSKKNTYQYYIIYFNGRWTLTPSSKCPGGFEGGGRTGEMKRQKHPTAATKKELLRFDVMMFNPTPYDFI